MSKVGSDGKLTEGSVKTLRTLLPESASLLVDEVSGISGQNPIPQVVCAERERLPHPGVMRGISEGEEVLSGASKD